MHTHTELVAPTDTVLKTVEAVLLRVKKLTRINVPAAKDWRLGVRTFNRGLEVLNTSKDWIYYLSWVALSLATATIAMKRAFFCRG